MRRSVRLAFWGFVILTLAWVAWDLIAQRQLREKIDEAVAKHQAVYFSDLDFSAVPDQVNAAYYYRAAAAAISTTAIGPSSSNLVFQTYPPFPANWQTMIDRMVAADGKTLALARRARDFDQVDWGVRVPPAMGSRNILLSFLSPMRGLALVVIDGAQQAHAHGDDAEALRRIFDSLHLADMVQERSFLIGRLVSIGIEAAAVVRIEVMSIDMRVADNRAEVKKLIERLLDDQHYRDGRMKMAQYEGASAVSDALALAQRATLLRPMVYLGIARLIDENAQLQLASSQANSPAAAAIASLPPLSALPFTMLPNFPPPRISRYTEFTFGHRAAGRYLTVEYRLLSQCHMAAVSLAVNLYHADHGNWPADLNSLVPNYLTAVPDDPFWATPHPIGYVVVNGTRPMTYCDTNGIATTAAPPVGPAFGWSNNIGTRQWVDITDWWQKSGH